MGVGRRRVLCACVCVFSPPSHKPHTQVSKPHLEHGDFVLPVDLVGRRVKPRALAHVLIQDAAALHVAQAELAQVQLRKSGREHTHTQLLEEEHSKTENVL